MSTRIYVAILVQSYNILLCAFYERQQVLDIGLEVCPYTNFCHADARKIRPNDTEDEPCCLPCSCDDDCWAFENCCLDKDLIDVTRPRIVPCIDSYVNPRNTYGGHFRVIDTCTGSKDGSNLEPKCSRENRTSFEDFVWVSDETGKIYLNKHCAKCHGIKETIPWQIRTTCFDILTTTFDNVLEALLSENCNIINTLPEGLNGITDRYKCFETKELVYSSCNETGVVTDYSPDIEMACEQITWPYILGFHVAKNVFCAMCNEIKPIATLGCNIHLDGKGVDTAFTFLIDYSSLSGLSTEEESECGRNELYDKFMGLCRNLLCPIGTAPFYGNCKQLVSQINGYAANIQFYLDIIWNQTSPMAEFDNNTIWNVTYAQFIEAVDLNSNCEVCQKIIDMNDNSTSHLILVVTLKFNSMCDYGLALTKLADMQGRVIEVRYNRTTVLTLLVQSDKQPSTLLNWPGSQNIFYDKHDNCKAGNTLSFDDIACPRLELNYAELEMFSLTKNQERDIFASFFLDTGSDQNVTKVSVSVCLDKYISVMSQLNQAASSDDKVAVQVLSAILVVLTVTETSCLY